MTNQTTATPEKKRRQGLQVDTKTYISTVIVLLVVMIVAGVLTQVLPQSRFERDGDSVILESYTILEDAPTLPVWRWLTAPFEVLGSENGLMAIVIILFVVIIGGTFMLLDKSGVMRYIVCSVVNRYGDRKYLLLAVMVFVGMLMGSACGMFEETAALVPIMIGLSLALGWDSLVAVGMSIMAVGFGFAAGTLNPFSVVVAQKLAGVPVYSGLLVRVGVFLMIYIALTVYLLIYARRIEKNPEKSLSYETDKELRVRYTYERDDAFMNDKRIKKATTVFICCFMVTVAYIIASMFVTALGDYTMIVLLLSFAIGGLSAGHISGYETKSVFGDFCKGMLSIAPCALLVILAMSAKQIVTAGGVMDTILYETYMLIRNVPPMLAILMIYGAVLVLEFFISSASAKAFIVIPLVVPLVQMMGTTGQHISEQTVVLAYCFGDGFSNMFMPTNAALCIVLGLINLSYSKWFRWSWLIQFITLVLTAGVLMLCVRFGYN